MSEVIKPVFVLRVRAYNNLLHYQLILKNNSKVYKMSEVKISYTIGDVFIERGDTKRKIEAVPSGKNFKWIRLKDGDRISTASRSYVVDLSDEPGPTQTGTIITAFPNSELVLGIKGIIRKIELIKGLFRIVTEKEVITPSAKLRYPQGNAPFWVDVIKDGVVVVASEAAPMEVIHKRTKKGVVISFKQQVSVTQEDILEPCGIDQRFKEAYKTCEMLEQSKAKFLYGDMLERGTPQEFAKLAKVIEEKTGRKEDYDLPKYQKWLKEQKEFGERKFDDVVESELPEFKSVKAEEKTTPTVKSLIMDINKTIKYQGINFKIISAEKTSEFKARNAPEGGNFLILNVGAKNNSANQIFVFYDEEARLIKKNGDIIGMENYKMETSFAPQTENKGNFLFIIPKESTTFKLQFGKKSLPKVEIELDLTEKEVKLC